MRAYTVATTAVTLKMPLKWLDNVLSQNHVDGVIKQRQGVARKLTPRAIMTLEVALRLTRAFSSAIPIALEIAGRIVARGQSEARIDAGNGLSLLVDLRQIEADMTARLAHAVEIAPSPRRGRPRRKD